jgi:hypothetical protein
MLDEINEPEPDAYVTRLPLEDYPDNPTARDVVLVVDVNALSGIENSTLNVRDLLP